MTCTFLILELPNFTDFPSEPRSHRMASSEHKYTAMPQFYNSTVSSSENGFLAS
jgi:hypothetical protein